MAELDGSRFLKLCAIPGADVSGAASDPMPARRDRLGSMVDVDGGTVVVVASI